jgi:hypothetical protein
MPGIVLGAGEISKKEGKGLRVRGQPGLQKVPQYQKRRRRRRGKKSRRRRRTKHIGL